MTTRQTAVAVIGGRGSNKARMRQPVLDLCCCGCGLRAAHVRDDGRDPALEQGGRRGAARGSSLEPGRGAPASLERENATINKQGTMNGMTQGRRYQEEDISCISNLSAEPRRGRSGVPRLVPRVERRAGRTTGGQHPVAARRRRADGGASSAGGLELGALPNLRLRPPAAGRQEAARQRSPAPIYSARGRRTRGAGRRELRDGAVSAESVPPAEGSEDLIRSRIDAGGVGRTGSRRPCRRPGMLTGTTAARTWTRTTPQRNTATVLPRRMRRSVLLPVAGPVLPAVGLTCRRGSATGGDRGRVRPARRPSRSAARPALGTSWGRLRGASRRYKECLGAWRGRRFVGAGGGAGEMPFMVRVEKGRAGNDGWEWQ
ncbi:hypothetical protein THAOC_02949 [Thalassiosira oceanica]|uniref:Uncharacterized protein n=1 Tax=Thalassiosira oceanica TaxID=159749 RepID=K0TDV5_THAOC|nr:hypothetical protein THAOC_02949 [Thalassiosira oceanica]|eukprot:EJK75329.1 hypothetical protein THAOC_02949 [Thalassiosira oceanica]